jgi:hypothetical protein
MTVTRASRRVWISVGLTIVLAGLLYCVNFVVDVGTYLDPWPDKESDRAMARYFHQHGAQFNALLDGYSAGELAALQLHDPSETEWLGDGVYFDRFSRGWLGGSYNKGYTHSIAPLPTVKNTDDAVDELVFHELGDGWYIYAYDDP